MSLFQNLKAFSIFKLRPIPSGSESFKPILEASRSPIFDLDLWFLKKIIFVSATTTFTSKSLRKSAWKLEKNFKKWFFYDFLKKGLCLIYGHLRVPNHLGTSEMSFGSILMEFEIIWNTFSKHEISTLKMPFSSFLLWELRNQAFCEAVSKPKVFFNFQVTTNPFQIWKLQTNPRSL